jgi:hypothetical protein
MLMWLIVERSIAQPGRTMWAAYALAQCVHLRLCIMHCSNVCCATCICRVSTGTEEALISRLKRQMYRQFQPTDASEALCHGCASPLLMSAGFLSSCVLEHQQAMFKQESPTLT